MREFQSQIAAEIEAAPNSALAQVAIQSIGDRDVARVLRCQAQEETTVIGNDGG
jgi:hypothetical protein